MKEIKEIKYRYICNICGKEIKDSMKGEVFWFDEELGRLRTETYANFDKGDIHLHNGCHMDITRLFPGRQWNPIGRHNKGERDCSNCGYEKGKSEYCSACEREDSKKKIYYTNWQAKSD